jgi:hypothetical protein
MAFFDSSPPPRILCGYMDKLLARHDEEALIIRSDDTSSCRRIFQREVQGFSQIWPTAQRKRSFPPTSVFLAQIFVQDLQGTLLSPVGALFGQICTVYPYLLAWFSMGDAYHVCSIAGYGNPGHADGHRMKCTFNCPSGIALDKQEGIWISDRHNRKYMPPDKQYLGTEHLNVLHSMLGLNTGVYAVME